jgi:hypothetical protein
VKSASKEGDVVTVRVGPRMANHVEVSATVLWTDGQTYLLLFADDRLNLDVDCALSSDERYCGRGRVLYRRAFDAVKVG